MLHPRIILPLDAKHKMPIVPNTYCHRQTAAKDLGRVRPGQVWSGRAGHYIVGSGEAAKYLGQAGHKISRSGPAGEESRS
jgi:hypothetical protein